MKHVFKIFIFATFIIASNYAYGQIDLGVIGGLHSVKNEVSPSDGFDTKSRLEYGFGLLVNLPISNGFGIQAQPMYLRKGGDIEIDGFPENVSVSADYFELPILASYTYGSGNVKPYAIVGPSIGFLLNAKQKASFIPRDQEDIKDVTKSIDFSLVFGLGAKIKIGSPSLWVQANYFHGVANLDDDSSNGDFTETINSRGIGFMVGVTFPIGN